MTNIIHNEPHPLAGQTVEVDVETHIGNMTRFVVEDWWDRLGAGSWMYADGNFAAMHYAVRGGLLDLPLDDEVVYGKDEHGLGHILHVTELVG